MNTSTLAPLRERSGSVRSIDIELLALDLKTCTRCVGSQANLEQALTVARQVLQVTGYEVRVRTILIESGEQARQHNFVTSPTIRINGHDIALEMLESHCDSCTDLCGCEEGTNCRVWRYQGQEYTEAPVGMIVDALLREVYSSAPSPSAPLSVSETPENLTRFFSSKAAKAAPVSACCPPSEQAGCCAPAEKASCCGPSLVTPSTSATGVASCGCK